MIVDSNIANAIDRYLKDNNKTARELCKMVGISEPAIIKWRRPGKGILQRHWLVLYPYIKNYLPRERIFLDENGEEQYSSALEGTSGTRPYFKPKYVPQMVPEFTQEQFENFNYVVDSVEQYASRIQTPFVEYSPKTPSGSGVFSIKSENLGIIPDGATIFVSSQLRPKNNSIVFFSEVGSNEIKIGQYKVVADKYSIVFGNEKIGGSINKIREKISFMFPVLYYEVVTF